MVATLVISLRILPDPEQIRDLHHPQLLQDDVIVVGNLSHAGFFAVHLDAGKIHGKPLFKPWIGSPRQDAIHKLVGVFVEHHLPGILHRHVQHDEAAVAVSLKESRQLRGFAVE